MMSLAQRQTLETRSHKIAKEERERERRGKNNSHLDISNLLLAISQKHRLNYQTSRGA